MSASDFSEALAVHGLSGWKASVHADPTSPGRSVAVITTADFNPILKRGRMVARTGTDAADAFARAVEAAAEQVRQ